MKEFKPFSLSFLIILGGLMLLSESVADKANPQELGKISWLRNLSQALEQAKNEQKAVFILFQEVPG